MTVLYNIPDLDIDVSNRDIILQHFKHIPASKITDKGITPHGVGAYFCDVPIDLVTNLCSVDYKVAEEEYGYIKIDVLHNVTYDNFKSRSELLDVMKKPIRWELLKLKNFVETLPHIGSYWDLMSELPDIDSIEKLAMFIAVIRPGKKYLIQQVKSEGWDSIKKQIWVKEETGYMYKKTHSISYALMISTLMR